MGLCRDDGLFILRKINKQQTDRVRKKIISIFKNIDYKMKIVTNITEVDFCEVIFILENHKYRLYRKPNERLSQNFSNTNVFNNTKLEYEKALEKCGHSKSNVYPT